MKTIGSPALFIGFGIFIAVMLAMDLGVFHRRAHAISIKEASLWSGVWIALALAFNLIVAARWGAEPGQAFLTGYLIEKALSVDNLFVFYVVFQAFAVPPTYQHRLLFWGVTGAVVLRGLMIWAGTTLLTAFHQVIYAFGIFLVATGVRMLARPHAVPHPEKSAVYRAVQRVIPTTTKTHGQRFFAREDGVLKATPLLLVLVLVELTDLVFAGDSILAIFAVTQDPFIVFTSNIFAIMGLRSLYFVLAGMAQRFVYLQPGLALVLVFVGVKMAISSFFPIPIWVSLAVVALLLGGSIGASLVKERLRPPSRPGGPGGDG